MTSTISLIEETQMSELLKAVLDARSYLAVISNNTQEEWTRNFAHDGFMLLGKYLTGRENS